MVFPIGMYFPLFFIQLDAVKRGLSEDFSFYTVNLSSFHNQMDLHKLTPVIVGHCQRSEFHRPTLCRRPGQVY
jgi:hypothetical protein